MNLKELDLVVLLQDLPDFSLRKGDVGGIVYVHNAGQAFEVEFATLAGDTLAVTTLPAALIQAVDSSQILHTRDFSDLPPARKSA